MSKKNNKKHNENGLKPHYQPNVKPYKKGVEVYPHTDYRNIEIYPHTEYHRQEPFWLYREIGLLKNWLISLTKLHTKLAELETNDVTDLTQEIKDLIDKLASFIAMLETDLEALYNAEKSYKANVTEMLGLIQNFEATLNSIINALNPLFEELFECIENRLIKHDIYINQIEDSIENIFNILENIVAQNTKVTTLTYNTDYSFTFFNSFYLDPDPINRDYVTLEETVMDAPSGSFHSKHLNLTFGGYHPLLNSYVYTQDSDDGKCPIFSHGSSEDRSNILILHILDENFPKKLNDTHVNNCLFQMTPYRARATWNIDCGVRYDDDYDGVRINMRTIADGYNNQYYYYVALGYENVSFTNCGLDIDLYYSYFA